MPAKLTKRRSESRPMIRCNTVEILFSPTKEPAELQAELRELAREIVSNLSELESAQRKPLLDSFVSELFSTVAKQEQREVRHQRQAEGIAAAKARGVRFGPQRRTLPDGFEELRQAWRKKEITLRTAAELCGVPKTTFREAALRVEMDTDGAEDAL